MIKKIVLLLAFSSCFFFNNANASVNLGNCILSGFTTSLNGIALPHHKQVICTNKTFSEVTFHERRTITGTNFSLTGFYSNEVYYSRCVITSGSAFSFTGITCIGQNFSNLTGATGPTGEQGIIGNTGNIVFTLSGYSLTTLSGFESSGSTSETIVNNVFDYQELTKSNAYGFGFAILIGLFLAIFSIIMFNLFRRIFTVGKK